MGFETSFAINREVRPVPLGWNHPRRDGRFVPLLPEQMPSLDDELPRDIGIAAYETTSEGTPISPFFLDDEEGRLMLVNWCAENSTVYGDHKADPETWAAILFGSSQPFASQDGRIEFA